MRATPKRVAPKTPVCLKRPVYCWKPPRTRSLIVGINSSHLDITSEWRVASSKMKPYAKGDLIQGAPKSVRPLRHRFNTGNGSQ